MLVLSRHKSEEIVITMAGIEVVVCLVEIRGDKARLGFTAPPEVSIHRREVQDAINRENAAIAEQRSKTA